MLEESRALYLGLLQGSLTSSLQTPSSVAPIIWKCSFNPPHPKALFWALQQSFRQAHRGSAAHRQGDEAGEAPETCSGAQHRLQGWAAAGAEPPSFTRQMVKELRFAGNLIIKESYQQAINRGATGGWHNSFIPAEVIGQHKTRAQSTELLLERAAGHSSAVSLLHPNKQPHKNCQLEIKRIKPSTFHQFQPLTRAGWASVTTPGTSRGGGDGRKAGQEAENAFLQGWNGSPHSLQLPTTKIPVQIFFFINCHKMM